MALDVRGVTALLEVFDMPRSITFYRDALGFEVVATSSGGDDYTWALLRLGDAELMLNTAYDDGQRPPSPDLARIAGHADTGLFFACADLDAAYAHLRSRGVAVEQPVVRDYGMRQLWVADPDGFRLCFQWPVE